MLWSFCIDQILRFGGSYTPSPKYNSGHSVLKLKNRIVHRWVDGSILRGDVDLSLTKKMTVQQAYWYLIGKK